MADRPIIFSAPMVRALLDGRKTMTRRIPTPSWQKAVPGDRLYVRESFQIPALCGVQYRATATERIGHWDPKTGPWRPSIHMPRWASRLTLVVTATKIGRLQEISEEDAKAEGIAQEIGGLWRAYEGATGTTARAGFAMLWNHLHGPESWDANPEVCAISFTVHKANIDQMKEAA